MLIITVPDVQVEKYFNSLPSNKVPKLGTAGEKYRDKQVVVQLPKQDLALTYCKHVEQRHHQSYEDFINARNEIALDIGYARECTYHVVSFYIFSNTIMIGPGADPHLENCASNYFQEAIY
jgi:hypothetical protein